MTNKPMLFLDVDGVLSPFIKKTPPRDWRNSWRKYEFPSPPGGKNLTFRDWLNPVQAEALYAFADRVDITWATTWNNYPEQLAALSEHLNFPSDLPTIGPTYGGNFIKLSTSSGRDKLHWQISSDKASSFLGDILPYLVYKHDQAWIAIAYQFSKDMSVSRDRDTGRILPKATNPLDRKVYMLLRELKKKDIDQVMADQDDLVEVVAVLHQILNYKGT